MARINGVNSDYAKQGDSIVPVDPEPANLELKLFICPYGEPNALEEESGTCTGTNTACPHSGASPGHAMIHLSQEDGISLETDDGNALKLFQAAGGPEGEAILLSPNGGNVRIDGGLAVANGSHTVTVTVDGSGGVTVDNGNGATVVLKPGGDIDLNTVGGTGTVNIQGNLVVSGTLTRSGVMI